MSPAEGPDVTVLLRQAREGNRNSESFVLEYVYETLRSRARQLLRGDQLASYVSSGTVVHDCFQKLFRGGSAVDYSDRAHFYKIAARAMRQVIVDHARAKNAQFRGGGAIPVDLESAENLAPQISKLDELIGIGQCCERLAEGHPGIAAAVELRFFSGLSIDATAGTLGVSNAIVHERLRFAKAFLRRELTRRAGENRGLG